LVIVLRRDPHTGRSHTNGYDACAPLSIREQATQRIGRMAATICPSIEHLELDGRRLSRTSAGKRLPRSHAHLNVDRS
jgi:hypothetical protein